MEFDEEYLLRSWYSRLTCTEQIGMQSNACGVRAAANYGHAADVDMEDRGPMFRYHYHNFLSYLFLFLLPHLIWKIAPREDAHGALFYEMFVGEGLYDENL
eukprot:2060469-Pyramimonas_sp.AAC.1